MIVSEPMIPAELIEALAERTRTNDVQWSLTKGHTYSTDLPECKLSLTASDQGSETPDIVFEVDTPDGAVIGVVQMKAGHPNYDDVRKVLNIAQSSARGRLEQILRRAAMSIKEAAITTTPPPMPPPPSAGQTQSLFQKIAGEWYLDFSRGIEILRIDTDGNYFAYPPKRATEPGVPPVLKYRFRLEHCDSELQQVELSKRELDGRVRQLEVLTIASLSMTGYAKHDAHLLRYSWNEWYQCQARTSKQVHLRARNADDAKQVYIRAMGIRGTPPEITVLKNHNFKPSASDLELDKTLYPNSPFSKEV